MSRSILAIGISGGLLGVATSAYAHTGNGFETGPLWFLVFVVSSVGLVGSGFLALIGKRSRLVFSVALFSAALLCGLALLPLIWPYPTLPGPVPL